MNHSQLKTYFSAILSKFSERHRAEIWCDLNRSDWPEEFADVRPDCWESMERPERMKLPIVDSLWQEVVKTTPHRSCLRAWNKQMSDVEFDAFWNEITTDYP